jgi:hypothetical protein
MNLAGMAGAGILVAVGVANAASVYDDNFDDGVMGSQWRSYTDTTKLSLNEAAGQLNVISNFSDNSHADALYLSNFRLSTAADFEIVADYAFPVFNPPATAPGSGGVLRTLGVDFGVGTDYTGDYSAAIGQGLASFKNPLDGSVSVFAAGAVAYRSGSSAQTTSALSASSPTGTFRITYNHTLDVLTLSEDGVSSITLTNLVAGTWHASDLLVSLGGRGDSEFSTSVGNAYLDNFSIVSGTLVPEPAVLGMLVCAPLALRRKRSA